MMFIQKIIITQEKKKKNLISWKFHDIPADPLLYFKMSPKVVFSNIDRLNFFFFKQPFLGGGANCWSLKPSTSLQMPKQGFTKVVSQHREEWSLIGLQCSRKKANLASIKHDWIITASQFQKQLLQTGPVGTGKRFSFLSPACVSMSHKWCHLLEFTLKIVQHPVCASFCGSIHLQPAQHIQGITLMWWRNVPSMSCSVCLFS